MNNVKTEQMELLRSELEEVKRIIQENNQLLKNNEFKEWLSLKEGAKYAGVCNNTFFKFRQNGLKVCVIDNVQKVSRKEIDRFLESYYLKIRRN